MNDRYNKTKLSSIIWHLLTPCVRVSLTVILLIIALLYAVMYHVFLQLIWYLLLLFLFMFNNEIFKRKVSRRKQIIINGILCFFLIGVIGSQIYTFRKYGSGDSVSAFLAISSIKHGTENIVLSGIEGGANCYLARSGLTEEELLVYFSNLEQRNLHIEDKAYDKAKYLYEGKRYVSKYVSQNRKTYQIVKYYK